MNEEREVQAEILKLARLLQLEPAELSYLERIPPAELRNFRDQVTERLFTAHEAVFRRLAAASRVLPVGLVASLAQHAFGPILSARLAEALEPDRADQVGASQPTAFIADIAIELDPRRASDVIARIPPERIFEITAELARRDEYVTMGRFVGQLTDGALASALKALDDEALIQTLFVMEDPLDMDRLARVTDRDRIDRLAALPGSPIPGG